MEEFALCARYALIQSPVAQQERLGEPGGLGER